MAQTKETADLPVQNGQNGSKVNGYQNGTVKSDSRPKAAGKSNGNSGGIYSTMKKFKPASKRPLPTQTGDGTYLQVDKRPGLRQDLRSLSMAGKQSLEFAVSLLY